MEDIVRGNMLVRIFTQNFCPIRFDMKTLRHYPKEVNRPDIPRKKVWQGELSYVPRINDEIILEKGLSSYRVLAVIEHLYDNSVDVEICSDSENNFDKFNKKKTLYSLNAIARKRQLEWKRNKEKRETIELSP